jgi:hypothetical protein
MNNLPFFGHDPPVLFPVDAETPLKDFKVVV